QLDSHWQLVRGSQVEVKVVVDGGLGDSSVPVEVLVVLCLRRGCAVKVWQCLIQPSHISGNGHRGGATVVSIADVSCIDLAIIVLVENPEEKVVRAAGNTERVGVSCRGIRRAGNARCKYGVCVLIVEAHVQRPRRSDVGGNDGRAGYGEVPCPRKRTYGDGRGTAERLPRASSSRN